MAHDGQLLARAREALEQDRAANQAEQISQHVWKR